MILKFTKDQVQYMHKIAERIIDSFHEAEISNKESLVILLTTFLSYARAQKLSKDEMFVLIVDMMNRLSENET